MLNLSLLVTKTKYLLLTLWIKFLTPLRNKSRVTSFPTDFSMSKIWSKFQSLHHSKHNVFSACAQGFEACSYCFVVCTHTLWYQVYLCHCKLSPWVIADVILYFLSERGIHPQRLCCSLMTLPCYFDSALVHEICFVFQCNQYQDVIVPVIIFLPSNFWYTYYVSIH